jgi:hypothetical protein
MTLPCKDCITLPICRQQREKWGGIIAKCTLINDYILSKKKKDIKGELDISYYSMELAPDRYQEFIEYMGVDLDGET